MASALTHHLTKIGIPVYGFLNLHKPASWTSHDCVAKTRRLLRLKRVGHAGTLDPAATGVLPIALGKATRLLQFLRQDKAYQATIRFGVTTTTDDLEGDAIASQPVPALTLEQVQAVLPKFQGVIEQIPPNYSAVQVQGKRLYDLARAGKEVEAPVRSVEVFHIEVLDWRPGDFPELDVAIACGSGTYIRSIARDLGAELQTGGTLATLIRTKSSGFDLAESIPLTALEAQLEQGTFHPIAPEVALSHLAAIALPDPEARRWCQGQRLPWNAAWETQALLSPAFRVHHEAGQFLGIGQQVKAPEGSALKSWVVLEASQ